MTRQFAIVKKYADANLNLPTRATNAAAGYDFEAAEDFVVPSIWRLRFLRLLNRLRIGTAITTTEMTEANQVIKPLLVPTGIKAYMNENEYLMLANRSSNPLKRGLILPNGVGIIDADYVDNPKNEGEIFIQIMNMGLTDVTIKKGERIAQGIFMPFLTTDADAADQKQARTGGFGSSGVK